MAPGTVQLNILGWNKKLRKYVKDGQAQKAMQLFQQIQQEGMSPDTFTFVQVINACAGLGALEEGRHVHEQIIQSGCESDVFVGNSLVDMYAKCGSIEDSWKMFKKMPSRDVVTWNTMILGRVKCGQGQKALELFQQMQQEGVQPNSVTFVGVLNACASVLALEDGRCAHKQIIESGWDSDIFVGSSLVDIYAKCGSMEDAWNVFKNMPSRHVVTWTTMILGHVKCGQGQKALELFRQMQRENVRPNSVTFVGVLNACASIVALEEGRCAHEQIIECGWDSDVFVGSSLVDMYAKCGSMEDAQRVFNKMPSHDVVTWNSMILGHVKCGQGQKALELFQQMNKEGVQPDSVTFVGVLNACASIVALEEGRCVHQQIIESGWDSNVFVGNSLVDMYAKCGSMEDAQTVFNKMPSHDVISWNAILGGCAMHGHGNEALKLFEQILHDFTKIGTLQLVDLLGRAGKLHEAENMIKAMPGKPYVPAWRALLAACKIHGNVEMGERVAKQFLELEPENAVDYVLLSNIYAAAGNRHLCENVELQRHERGVENQTGRTWIEVKNEVHSFIAGNQAHPQMIEIHTEL
ncbi:unnamed protein product [Sphagnum jensenii]|uniref:Pentatricopeptide repeat-containing protein n=1 Tax=Sphagnum jensenii TaxID=128206 RepID=A0ABP0WIQ2_9BRYO